MNALYDLNMPRKIKLDSAAAFGKRVLQLGDTRLSAKQSFGNVYENR